MLARNHGRPTVFARTRDNQSHTPSEGWERGLDLAVIARELNAGAGVGRLVEYRSHRRQDGAIDFRAWTPTVGLFSDDTLESLGGQVPRKGVHDCPVEQSIGERKTGPLVDVSVANRFSLNPGVVGGKPNVF